MKKRLKTILQNMCSISRFGVFKSMYYEKKIAIIRLRYHWLSGAYPISENFKCEQFTFRVEVKQYI